MESIVKSIKGSNRQKENSSPNKSQIEQKVKLWSPYYFFENFWKIKEKIVFFINFLKFSVSREIMTITKKYQANFQQNSEISLKKDKIQYYSKILDIKVKVFFIFITKKEVCLQENLIRRFLANNEKLKIIFVVEKKKFSNNLFFSKCKKEGAMSIFKKLKFYPKKWDFSIEEKQMDRFKIIKKKIGKPEIGKLVFLMGFEKEKSFLVDCLYRIGYSNSDLKIM